MAPVTTITTQTLTATKPPKPTKLVCFSFAAYAKTLIEQLISLNIPILPGLTDSEFASIESTFHFTFPPDLRSILQVGLPIGPHFPNWRSSSLQQLQILLNLPFLNLCKNVSQNNFWVDSWGDKPVDINKAMDVAKRFLDKAPVLVPVYRNCYIPCTPNMMGNPVFYVDDQSVRVLSFDVTRFFQEVEFLQVDPFGFVRPHLFLSPGKEKLSIHAPAWAATAARRIEFWTEAVERGRRVVARDATRGWWSGGDFDCYCKVRNCLEEVFWRLRDGGWKEEEVREMMMMDDCDHEKEKGCWSQFDKEDMEGHVRVLSIVLLRGGWSREDVLYSLDLQSHLDCNGTTGSTSPLEGNSVSEFQFPNSCSRSIMQF